MAQNLTSRCHTPVAAPTHTGIIQWTEEVSKEYPRRRASTSPSGSGHASMLWADWDILLHERSPAVDRPVGQTSAAIDGSGERRGSQGERLGTPRCVPRCSRHLGLW